VENISITTENQDELPTVAIKMETLDVTAALVATIKVDKRFLVVVGTPCTDKSASHHGTALQYAQGIKKLLTRHQL
jgi:3-deoxy-D-arabino-heptulosonate 7-phosphate (DAHP) synthase